MPRLDPYEASNSRVGQTIVVMVIRLNRGMRRYMRKCLLFVLSAVGGCSSPQTYTLTAPLNGLVLNVSSVGDNCEKANAGVAVGWFSLISKHYPSILGDPQLVSLKDTSAAICSEDNCADVRTYSVDTASAAIIESPVLAIQLSEDLARIELAKKIVDRLSKAQEFTNFLRTLSFKLFINLSKA